MRSLGLLSFQLATTGSRLGFSRWDRANAFLQSPVFGALAARTGDEKRIATIRRMLDWVAMKDPIDCRTEPSKVILEAMR